MKRDIIFCRMRTLVVFVMLVALSSCEKIYDDLEACPHGVSLRFVYDYHMERAMLFRGM